MSSALVVGEALVDVVDGVAHPGGSPLNVAVGLARLGVRTVLHTAFGSDAYGVAIAQHLEASGVAVTPATVGTAATSVAEVKLASDGAASYDFRVTWDPGPVDAAGFDLVHAGSIGAALEPGAALVEGLLASAEGLVSFDPNVRTSFMGDRAAAVARIERLIGYADIVKASDEDARWLYPESDPSEVLAKWAALGPRLVVLTRGGEGADALATGAAFHVDSPPTTVADTIGAGDSFMSGLLTGILERGFDDVPATLAFAARCAAITVSRPGADPPRHDEL